MNNDINKDKHEDKIQDNLDDNNGDNQQDILVQIQEDNQKDSFEVGYSLFAQRISAIHKVQTPTSITEKRAVMEIQKFLRFFWGESQLE